MVKKDKFKNDRRDFNQLPNQKIRWALRNTAIDRSVLADELDVPTYTIEWILWTEMTSAFEEKMVQIIKGILKGEAPRHLKGDEFVAWANAHVVDVCYAEYLRKEA